MKPIGTNLPDALGAGAGLLCISAAFALAVFFHGPQLTLFAGAQALLVIWLTLALARRYDGTLDVPLTPVALWLTLFWAWLGLSTAWSPVPAISIINFWWIGTLALVYWAYTLSPARDRIWFYGSRAIWGGTLALCAYALVQKFGFGDPPRATFINIHSLAALVMLVALPAAAAFVAARHQRARPVVVYSLGISLFVFFFTIGLTGGRGTTLSLVLAMALVTVLGARLVGRRPVLVLLAVAVGAYIAANFALYGGLSDRLASLADPADAGSARFLIWRGSWQMLLENPWWGIGLGIYYLAWPPFRDPSDSSLGFFVHNDYLQIWIEAGLPALLLLLATLIAVGTQFVRVYRHTSTAVLLRLEVLGLFAGLLAVAAHSVLDFNLYILPILIVAGLVLGRLHECADIGLPPRQWRWRPAGAPRRYSYRLILILLMLLPLSYLTALGLFDYLYKRAYQLALVGDLPQAHAALRWCERLAAHDDRVWTMHADLYRHVLLLTPRANLLERQALYDDANAMLTRAESLNPYRALVHTVRARLIEENRDLAGAGWLTPVEAGYQRALALDPRFYQARMDYARVLTDAGRGVEAYRLLDDGIFHWYYPQPVLFAYYDMAARLAEHYGDAGKAKQIRTLAAEKQQAMAGLAAPRPVVADAPLPAKAPLRSGK